MKDTLLLFGFWRHLIPLPRALWRREVARGAQRNADRLAFMTEEHHRVRDYCVLELPRSGKPLPPLSIARSLGLPVERVLAILDDLERHLTFVFRNPTGDVAWAYPVTAEKTSHRLTFSSGERLYAA